MQSKDDTDRKSDRGVSSEERLHATSEGNIVVMTDERCQETGALRLLSRSQSPRA
eukprot:CAMPEP_0203825934 /NCGR_PEP_ID=MMETSP0115-20131106/55462_1 /ASSEMBLY_ACC=CAM_ASM_000227 /TAXON_ID=33651 /ORGANISM="Bicosoecid sp, Strain ms1" /LENGTH=54 /DNA_ID=CAMNT_0050734977 /DNA_START=35 /DNA_END=196 /DNA_ORIENTATION=-